MKAEIPVNPANPVDAVPLCMDLDGTLLKTDLLFESLLVLLARNPFYLFLLPLWLLSGKAHLKREIARRAPVDASTLPYDARALQLLEETTARPRVLCTASDIGLAQAVADHLGLFELVIASDGEHNVSGRRKAELLCERFGARGFDYAGNERVDLHVWRQARRAWVLNAPESLARAAATVTDVAGYLPGHGTGPRVWLKALRLHQWLKNLLVFLPLLAAHRFLDPVSLLKSSLAFLAFGLCASGVYVLNDLLDLESDRAHRRKRLRPFAAGRLPLAQGLVVAPLLMLLGFVFAFACNPWFAGVLAVYLGATFAYSLRLKRVVMLDVVVLAGLYTTRIIGGAVAIASGLSFWLLAFSMFLFFSLALLKRYVELADLLANGGGRASGRGYGVDDVPLLQSLGGASGYIAVMVLALYINSPESLALYTHPQMLWLLCPVLLYWVSRIWVVAHRGGMNDDPVIFAVTDRVSQLAIALCAVFVLGAI
jgi:4-hydroxybenzoate polyprenyltransferase